MKLLLLFLLFPQGAQHWIDVEPSCPIGSRLEFTVRSASPTSFYAQPFCSLEKITWKIPGTPFYCDLGIDYLFQNSVGIFATCKLYDWEAPRSFLSQKRSITIPNWSYLVGINIFFQSAAHRYGGIIGVSNMAQVLITGSL